MSQALLAARTAIARAAGPGLTLIGVSGGADSLALAIAAATLPDAFGAVIVDHGLQPGSAQVAQRAAGQCRELGLDPVLVYPVQTNSDEASARAARYEQFELALNRTGAQRMLLAHTRDDQAEQVLLGLIRGSGTRSLAGIPAERGPYRRPLLDLSRKQTEEICQDARVDYWEDPSNSDTGYRRNLIRHEILPFLAERLGGHLPEALARTASLAAADADALDQWAQTAKERHGLNLRELSTLPVAVASRVLRLFAIEAGAKNVGHERTQALCALAGIGGPKSKSAGPVQLDGKISAFRRGPVIVFTGTGSTTGH
ncbi:tRNA lysidine(34) synthetase TilS [Glutamicibacter mishrai]|uniref:tRNA lysidine(34) synthetase TilS n=1 Tax=Glutamicibacter mishrai TaxID=1775880 RepID=UPI0020CF6314|nr:tRNA lysidine(34) synthetase TilS [Glutamicibacter mishrai]UTT39835.1 tRNA lysidine(34) synthetase TilS [Glutamicibacter mishrai]